MAASAAEVLRLLGSAAPADRARGIAAVYNSGGSLLQPILPHAVKASAAGHEVLLAGFAPGASAEAKKDACRAWYVLAHVFDASEDLQLAKDIRSTYLDELLALSTAAAQHHPHMALPALLAAAAALLALRRANASSSPATRGPDADFARAVLAKIGTFVTTAASPAARGWALQPNANNSNANNAKTSINANANNANNYNANANNANNASAEHANAKNVRFPSLKWNMVDELDLMQRVAEMAFLELGILGSVSPGELRDVVRTVLGWRAAVGTGGSTDSSGSSGTAANDNSNNTTATTTNTSSITNTNTSSEDSEGSEGSSEGTSLVDWFLHVMRRAARSSPQELPPRHRALGPSVPLTLAFLLRGMAMWTTVSDPAAVRQAQRLERQIAVAPEMALLHAALRDACAMDRAMAMHLAHLTCNAGVSDALSPALAPQVLGLLGSALDGGPGWLDVRLQFTCLLNRAVTSPHPPLILSDQALPSGLLKAGLVGVMTRAAWHPEELTAMPLLHGALRLAGTRPSFARAVALDHLVKQRTAAEAEAAAAAPGSVAGRDHRSRSLYDAFRELSDTRTIMHVLFARSFPSDAHYTVDACRAVERFIVELSVGNPPTQAGVDGPSSSTTAGSTPHSAHACAVCGVAGGADGGQLKRCGGCQGPRYCSIDCQRRHWKQGHKGECKGTAAQGGGS